MRDIFGTTDLSAALRAKQRSKLVGVFLIIGALAISSTAAQRRKAKEVAPARSSGGPAAASSPVSSLTITTQPNAIVWIDDVRRGVTDASGKLVLTKISSRGHTLRVRANGFKEFSSSLLPGRRSITVKLA